MKLIVFEGIDKSGKSTLARAFNKATNYKHMTVDRLFMSQIAYSIIYKRARCIDSVRQFIEKFQAHEILIVYIKANKDIIEKRLDKINHEFINIERDQIVFDTVYEYINCDKMIVDTSNKSIEECIIKIKDFIGEVE